MRFKGLTTLGRTPAATPESYRPRHVYLTLLVPLFALLLTKNASAEPSTLGQTGLINMPSARIEEEGTLRLGLSTFDPYTRLWSSITLLPRFELSGRYTEIDRVRGFEDNDDFGDFKDKAFDAKLLMLRESRYRPAISIGTQDFTGTQLFSAKFIALSKQFGDFDVTLGYGDQRIDGGFGGVRYRPSWNKKLRFVMEYDANDYENDFQASTSGADEREGGPTYAFEYKSRWFGTQLSFQSDVVGANIYASIPLTVREFVPNTNEPAPYTKVTSRPTMSEWRSNIGYPLDLVRALQRQGYKNVQLSLKGSTLEANLTHSRISLMSRAVGRAARTIFLLGPRDIDSIRITYTVNDLPVLTYTFKDTYLLQYYFDGLVSQQRLAESVEIVYSSPEHADQSVNHGAVILDNVDASDRKIKTIIGEEGHILLVRRQDAFLSGFELIPFNLRFFFNDPSGAFKFDTFSLAKYSKHFGRGFFFNTSARLTLFEDVSDVTQPSNSVLPHVRSDVALYKQGDDLRLDTLLFNQYFHPRQRVYARLSAGYYEEMFGGFGGQILYLPKKGNWAIDLSVDSLKQRDPDDSFEFIDYSVVTALGAFHYRFPALGLTTTARAGRFLADDDGIRLELKRRFRSGVEVGAWYTVTNGDDITTPGSPDDPYRDKGIFISVPLSTLLTKDTQVRSNLSLSPWTRDVGQMVISPDDLYQTLERPLMFGNPEYGPLTDLEK